MERPEHPDRRDPKGYYACLGVPPTASAEEIKLAFRRQAKTVHPDRNPGAGAKDAFQRLNEAYQLLSDPVARARYDAPAPPSRPKPAASRTAAAAAAPPGRGASAGGVVEPIACCRCGVISEQPRYATYWRVVSFAVGSVRQQVQGVFCRACADRRGLAASAVTWLLGWWGLPWGPVWTVKALWCNLWGGDRPADVNASLLTHQARYFIATGKPVQARAALDQALRLVRRPEQRQKLQKMRALIGEGGPEPLVDDWRPAASYAFYLHLLPVLLVAGGTLVLAGLLLLSALPASPPASSPPGASAPTHTLWRVVSRTAVLRDGPASDHRPIGHVQPSQPVEILARDGEWAKIRTESGLIGFVDAEALTAGAPPE